MGFFRNLFGGKASDEERRAEAKATAGAGGIGPDATVQIVRAYLVTVDPNYIIGIQHNEEWYLPGGIVEGPGRPEGMPPGQHFEPLAWHLKEQTGLTLDGLSDAVGLELIPSEGGMDATVLYAGRASGKQTRGSRFALDEVPDFASICGVSAQRIRNICGRI